MWKGLPSRSRPTLPRNPPQSRPSASASCGTGPGVTRRTGRPAISAYTDLAWRRSTRSKPIRSQPVRLASLQATPRKGPYSSPSRCGREFNDAGAAQSRGRVDQLGDELTPAAGIADRDREIVERLSREGGIRRGRRETWRRRWRTGLSRTRLIPSLMHRPKPSSGRHGCHRGSLRRRQSRPCRAALPRSAGVPSSSQPRPNLARSARGHRRRNRPARLRPQSPGQRADRA